MSADLASRLRAAASAPRMFLLDGGGARPWSGRRSVLGVLADDDVSLTFDAASRTVLRHRSGRAEPVGDDVFAVLEEEVARDGGDPSVSWVGYLGYACRTDLPGRPSAAGGAGPPDAVWMRVVDPEVLHLDPTPPAASPSPPSEPVPPVDPRYAAGFEEVQRRLRAGDTYEVNLTYRERLRRPTDPVTTYLRLRRLNPAPYAGFLRHHGVRLLSSSPERFATVDRHRMLETRPIKGTTPRAEDPAADAEQVRRLATEPRFRAENLMIVDLLRNDVAAVCEVGSVEVPTLMEVESYQAVHQLVSVVRGRLRPEVSTVSALRSLFPAGSMTGAPKRRTMEVVDAVEADPRGVYAGAFGWLSADGRADLAVVIRSLVATPARDGWCYELGTGGGVTVHSALAEEWAETRWKAARVRAALR